MKTKYLILSILSPFLFLFSNDAYSQFGKNKVQYMEFHWKYLQSKHFDVYFYQGGDFIASYTAQVAEESLNQLQKNLDYNISNRIPIIVFLSHNEFQQNNAIDEFLPEGVGGVTELFKNRILVPFEGDYEKFRHVIHHELLHAFMNDMYYGGSIQNIISKNITLQFPLWFSEGMAEVQSLYGLDKATDMYIRDLVINNYLPPLEYIGGYLAYRGGQSFFAFLGSQYGVDKLGDLMINIKALGDVYAGFEETYKMSVEKLGEKWQKELKKRYWPEIDTKEEVMDFSKRLTNHEKDGGFYNVAPKISPNGEMFAFISNRDDLFSVYLAKTSTGEVIEMVLEGNNSADFEELNILTPGLTWSPNGRFLAVSSKSGSQDAITVINVNSGDRERLPVFNNEISYLAWSPTEEKIAFIGQNNKQSDVYIYDRLTRKTSNLTDDIFSDEKITWSPDGKFIYFTSDRGDYLNRTMIPSDFNMAYYESKGKDIYKLDVSNLEISRETNIDYSIETDAQISSDGTKMIYTSDVSGITNVYIRETDTSGNVIDRPITNSLSPIDQISISKDGKKMLFVSLNKGAYDIFSMDNPFDKRLDITEIPPTEFVKERFVMEGLFGKKTEVTAITDSVNSVKDTLFTVLESNDSAVTLTDSTVIVNQTDSSTLYGQDIKINFENQTDTLPGKKSYLDSMYAANKNFKIDDNLNPDGTFRINKYKVRFTPDLVYGNANYSSFYGVQGVAQISLSDMLGNHRINIITSMVIDLKNSDYGLAYYYLPKRIDYGMEIFHTARFVLYNRRDGNGDQLFRYRNFGGSLLASYPINRFKRIDGGLSVSNISRENLDNSLEPIERKTLMLPSLSFVHDNTIFNYNTYSPEKGTRYNISVSGSPKFGESGLGFVNTQLDYRTYFKIGTDYSFAWRFAGGASFGPNPVRYYIGGVPNWINREFQNDNIPISNIEEFAFSQAGLPLRGYNYDAKSGSKYAMMNMEFRYPIFKYLILGLLPIGFQDIMGVAFLDMGTAWRDDADLKLFEKKDGSFQAKDLLIGTGVGTRAIFLNFPIKFDVAWNTNLKKWSKPKYYISLGFDF